MKTFYAKSPAKLNIGLHILGRWPEGYHVLETLLVPYPALYDDLEVRLLPGKDRLQFRLSGIQIPESEGRITFRSRTGDCAKASGAPCLP